MACTLRVCYMYATCTLHVRYVYATCTLCVRYMYVYTCRALVLLIMELTVRLRPPFANGSATSTRSQRCLRHSSLEKWPAPNWMKRPRSHPPARECGPSGFETRASLPILCHWRPRLDGRTDDRNFPCQTLKIRNVSRVVMGS